MNYTITAVLVMYLSTLVVIILCKKEKQQTITGLIIELKELIESKNIKINIEIGKENEAKR